MDPPGSSPPGPDAEPAGPKPIRKLTEDVVNRIAAAEVGTTHAAETSRCFPIYFRQTSPLREDD